MDDLEGILKDSPDDQEMKNMAAEEQQQLQEQVSLCNQHYVMVSHKTVSGRKCQAQSLAAQNVKYRRTGCNTPQTIIATCMSLFMRYATN